MYGGRLADGSLSADLWLYQVVGGRWTLRAQHSAVRPPPLAHHSLTLVRDGWLYILGGSTEQGMFSSKIFKIKLSTGLCGILSACLMLKISLMQIVNMKIWVRFKSLTAVNSVLSNLFIASQCCQLIFSSIDDRTHVHVYYFMYLGYNIGVRQG